MGFFSKASDKDREGAQDPHSILEGHPEVPDSITPYEAGLMSAIGKTSQEMGKTAEGVLQALLQSAGSPYTYSPDSGNSNTLSPPTSSQRSDKFETYSCNEDKQLVKDCLLRITAEVKARRFEGSAARTSDTNITVRKGAVPATPPPSFLFADFPSCEQYVRRYVSCSERAAADYHYHYAKRVEVMHKQREEVMTQRQQNGQPAD
eukprot:GILI01028279.1.p1 GENE.GILI01028279.1~~GILI01028279.1.p1  ORF type:complete len:205 (+),score=32.19 GILI01028279.1:55-669(+)